MGKETPFQQDQAQTQKTKKVVGADSGKGRTLSEEDVARAFHEAYERLAPEFGYETRPESAVPWEQVPEANRRLMVAVVSEVLALLERERRD